MSLRLNTHFGNAALPVLTPLGEQIKADARVAFWWQADTAYATIAAGGGISALVPKDGAGNFVQGTLANQPALAANKLNGYPAAVFDGTDDRLVFSTTTGTMPDFALPHSIVFIGQADATPTGSQQIFARFSAAAVQTALSVLSAEDTARFQHGTGTVTAPYTRGAPGLIIADALTASGATTIGLEVNGTPSARVASNNAVGGAALVMGALNSGGSQPLKGFASDIIVCNVSVQDAAHADLRAMLRKYASKVYGISVAA
jgi:hypothetical protein